MWTRKLETEAVEAFKFLWKRKRFEERSSKRKQTRKRLTLHGAGSGSKKYSTAFKSLVEILCIENKVQVWGQSPKPPVANGGSEADILTQWRFYSYFPKTRIFRHSLIYISRFYG